MHIPNIMKKTLISIAASLFALPILFLPIQQADAAIIAELAEYESQSRCDDWLSGLECNPGGVCSGENCGVSGGKHLFCNVEADPDECNFIDEYCANNPTRDVVDTSSFGGSKKAKPVIGIIEGIEDENGNKLTVQGCEAYIYLNDKKSEIKRFKEKYKEAQKLYKEAKSALEKAKRKQSSESPKEKPASSFVDLVQPKKVNAAEDEDKEGKGSNPNIKEAEEIFNRYEEILNSGEEGTTAKEFLDFSDTKRQSTRTDWDLNFSSRIKGMDEIIENFEKVLDLLGEEGSSGASDVITGGGLALPDAGSIKGVSQSTDVEEVGVGIINWALGFVALIAVAILIFGGFMMITARGDDSKYETGKKTVIYAVIGILIIMASWTIVNTVLTSIT